MSTSLINPANTRSDEFRYVFANSFALQFTGVECIVTFGVARDPQNADKGMEEQVAVVLTLAGAKAVTYMLRRILDHHEKLSGFEIPLSPSVLSALENALKQAEEKAKDK